MFFTSGSASYDQNYVNYLSKNALSKTLNVHPGTKNNNAGYGCPLNNITDNVATIPIAYPTKHHKK